MRELAGEGDSYDFMTGLAAATPPGAEGLFLLPFFGGGSTPNPIFMAEAFSTA